MIENLRDYAAGIARAREIIDAEIKRIGAQDDYVTGLIHVRNLAESWIAEWQAQYCEKITPKISRKSTG